MGEIMKMIRVLLVSTLLSIVLGTCAQDDSRYCRQYEITESGNSSTFSEPICYRSMVSIIITHKEIFVATDSITIRFVIIYHTRSLYQERDNYLAAMVGQPSQIYAIQELRDKAGGYYFSCSPTRFNERTGRVAGIHLDISNKQICE